MELQEFIDKCHAVQHDAGSRENFGKKVEKALEVCGDENLDDPVAAFLGALVINGNGDINEAIDGLEFWMSELTRVYNVLKKG
jgi:hypothetical protein